MTATDELIYLDNNATTQLDPGVIEEMVPFLREHYGNPSSGYAFAAKARKAVDFARERLGALLGCEPSEIVFTSGGTESNNAVINTARCCSPARISRNAAARSRFSVWMGTEMSILPSWRRRFDRKRHSFR
jgi:cysteine sulfinate desulfinase/cysteine desulfurase-like protein